MPEEPIEKDWKEYNPSKFTRNENRQEEFDSLMDAIGEYATDNFLRMGAWYLYSLQIVPMLEFAKEYVNELENWRYRMLPALVAENPDEEDIQRVSVEPPTVRELGFLMMTMQHESTCCIAHGLLAFNKLRPYLPVISDEHPSRPVGLPELLAKIFGGEISEPVPGVAMISVGLSPSSPKDAFEAFLENGEIPPIQHPGNDTDN